MKYDFLIVGSGLFGATFANIAFKAGKRCLVIEKRPHIGGNVYTQYHNGILVHEYGPHIFHTNDKEVWDYVNSFSTFNNFVNHPLAFNNGKLYNLPFNMNTFQQIWSDVQTPSQAKKRIIEQCRESKIIPQSAKNLEEYCLSTVGYDIYNLLIKEYTEKQWGRPCTELHSFLIGRLPLRFIFDNNYFNDRYQGIPVSGYTDLVNSMLRHIDIELNTDFFDNYINNWSELASTLIYTGSLDRFFAYKYGTLEWRSLRFDVFYSNTHNLQGNAVVNYISKTTPWTRQIEHKHFYQFGYNIYNDLNTVYTKEYPVEYKPGLEPYYPINDRRNNEIKDLYLKSVSELENVYFGGRLATYCYLNMDEVIRSAFNLCKKLGLH